MHSQVVVILIKLFLQVIQIQALYPITLGAFKIKSNGSHHRKEHDIMKYIKRISVLLLAAFCMVAGMQVVQADEDTRVTFTNEENKTPDLFITKHVESADDRYEVPKDVAFKFVLKLNGKLANKEQYRVFNESGDEVFNHSDGVISSNTTNKIPFMTDRNGNFTLYGGYTAKFEYVGNGASYEISELPQENFQQVSPAAGTSAVGTIKPDGARVEFVNLYVPYVEKKTTDLVVTKHIAYPQGYVYDEETSFNFTLKLEGKPYANEIYTIKNSDTGEELKEARTDANGKFSLQGGQSATFKEVKADVDYEVVEEKADGWRVLGDVKQSGATQAPVTAIQYTNAIASFGVNKTMSDKSASDKDFKFLLSDHTKKAWSNAEYYLYNSVSGKRVDSVVHKTDANGYFTLKANQTAIFLGIAPGTMYNVQEIAEAGYIQKTPISSGGYENKVVGDNVEIVPFVNEPMKEEGTLSVTKLIENTTGEIPMDDIKFTFVLSRKNGETYEVVQNANYIIPMGDAESTYKTNAAGEFQLKGNQTAIFKELKQGETYKVEEKQINVEYKISLKEQEGQLDKNISFTFTNVYTPKEIEVYLKKANRDKEALDGAEFCLYSDAKMTNEIARYVSGSEEKLLIDNLRAGTYYLKETKSPNGYKLLEDSIKIVITREEGTGKLFVKINGKDITQAGKDDQIYGTTTVVGEKDEVHILVYNDKNFRIPITGGNGIALFIGIAVIGCAGVLLVLKKKVKSEH